MSEYISSGANKLIKEIASLKQRKYRDMRGLFLAEGIRLVEECAHAGWPAKLCFYTEEAAARERAQAIIAALSAASCRMIMVPAEIYNKLSDTEQPQGIMAVLHKRPCSIEQLLTTVQPPLLAVLDGIQDPGNAGTIIRTADAAGCTGVIALKGSTDIYAAKTVRATMGSLFHLPVLEGISAAELIAKLKQANIKLLATGLQPSAAVYHHADFTGPAAIVFGNEGQGVCSELIQSADTCLTIPLIGHAESLNVAVAAGVILYEAVRQRTIL